MPDVYAAHVTESRCRRRRDQGAYYRTVGLAVRSITNRALLGLNSYWFPKKGTSTFQVQVIVVFDLYEGVLHARSMGD